MDASNASTDPKTGRDPSKALVSDGVTFLPNHQGKVGFYSVQTFNGSQSMNCHGAGGGAAPSVASMSGVLGGGSALSKVQPSSVIQTPLVNAEGASAAQPGSQAASGPTVTLVRPPAESGATLNGSPALATSQTAQAPPAHTGQPGGSASVSAGSHVVKAEPPTTIIQSAPQPTGTISAPRPPVMAATGGAIPQMLTPRLPQPNPGQPSVHNIQLPPGKCRLKGLFDSFCSYYCKNDQNETMFQLT